MQSYDLMKQEDEFFLVRAWFAIVKEHRQVRVSVFCEEYAGKQLSQRLFEFPKHANLDAMEADYVALACPHMSASRHNSCATSGSVSSVSLVSTKRTTLLRNLNRQQHSQVTYNSCLKVTFDMTVDANTAKTSTSKHSQEQPFIARRSEAASVFYSRIHWWMSLLSCYYPHKNSFTGANALFDRMIIESECNPQKIQHTCWCLGAVHCMYIERGFHNRFWDVYSVRSRR